MLETTNLTRIRSVCLRVHERNQSLSCEKNEGRTKLQLYNLTKKKEVTIIYMNLCILLYTIECIHIAVAVHI